MDGKLTIEDMKTLLLLSGLFIYSFSSVIAQNDQNDLLKSIFTEAGNSYTWKFEQTAPTPSKDLKYSDSFVSFEFVPMDEKQLCGPYLWSFWITNNTSAKLEINWENSYLTSLKGTQRKVYHGDMKSIPSGPQKNTSVGAKTRVGDAVVPKESVTTTRHNGEYNDRGEWVEPWNEITGYQVFYGEDFPNDYTYETLKAACEGKSFTLHLALMVNGAAKNYDFKFKVISVDKTTAESNPLLDVLNQKPATEITVGTRVKGNWHNQGILYLGKVIEINGDQYHIEYDDGDKEWTTIDKLQIAN